MKVLLGSLFALALPFAVAQADRGPGGRPPGPPPQAAFAACANSRAGDACSMTLHDHTITGTCAQPPDSTALACRPDHPPGPPPEAVAACTGKSAGDTCSITHDGHSFSGTCAPGPAGSDLACRPSNPPPR